MFFNKTNNFLPNFLSLKDKVKEIGYFGFDDDEVYLTYPLNQLNMFAFTSITKNNPDIVGVKTKYFICCSKFGDIQLKNLSNYDVFEDIKLFDGEENEIEFNLIICDETIGTCSMTKEKTIYLNSSLKYTLIPKHEIKSSSNIVYVKGYVYTFDVESRKLLHN